MVVLRWHGVPSVTWGAGMSHRPDEARAAAGGVPCPARGMTYGPAGVPWRRYLALGAAALLALVGCTSGDDAASPSEGKGAEEEALSGPAPGVTDDAIKIGITFVDLEAIRDVTTIDHGDYEAVYRAVIESINDDGGIHGRRLEPVFAPINPIGSAAAEAACTKLGQDEDVFVATGFFRDETVLCMLETQETAVVGGSMTKERLERARAPWFTAEASEDSNADAVRALAEEGLLSGKLGVVALATAQDELRERVEPLLDDLGVKPVEVAVIDAPPDDVAAQNNAVRLIAERFRSSDVEVVLAYGQSALTWANGIETLDYRPQMLFTSISTALAYVRDEAGYDESVLEDAALASPWHRFWEVPAFKECVETIEERTGTQIPLPPKFDGGPEPHVSARYACRDLALLVEILESAGRDLNYATFRKAGENLGEVALPDAVDPYNFGPTPSADGDPPVYVYDWDATDGEFVVRD